MGNLIELINVKKRYGKSIILENINLSIKPGEAVALTGHNGCGKSTMLRIISGLTSVQEGEVRVKDKIKFNYIPDNFPNLPITSREYIFRMGLIDGLSKEEIEKKSNYFFELFKMKTMINTPIKYLSKGTKQKVGVIQAMLTKPDVLLLDEPLSGQDISSQRSFIKLVNNLKEEGAAIVMSCHEKYLINAVSDRLFEIKNKTLKEREVIRQSEDTDVLVFEANENIELPFQNEKIQKIENKENELIIYVDAGFSNSIIVELISNGYVLRRMNSENI